MKERKKRYLWRSMLLITLLSMILSISTSAAGSTSNDKAIRGYLSYSGSTIGKNPSQKLWDKCTYDLAVYNTSKTKLGKKIQLSGDIIVPVKMFKSKKSFLYIRPQLNIAQNADKDYAWCALYDATRDFELSGKGGLTVYTPYENDNLKGTSLTKKSGYYIIHFVDTININKNENIVEEGQRINTSKYYNLSINFALTGSGLNKGYIYLDNLQIKTSTKTIKTTFEKKDYRAWGYTWRGNGNFDYISSKLKVVNRPVK